MALSGPGGLERSQVLTPRRPGPDSCRKEMGSQVSLSAQGTEYHTVCLPLARVGPVLDAVGNTTKVDTGPHSWRAPGLLGAGHPPRQPFYISGHIRKHRETMREEVERRLLGGGGVWCEPRLSSKPELSVAMMLAHWYGLTGDSGVLGTGFSQDQPSLLLLPATFWFSHASSHFFTAQWTPSA